MDLLGKYHDDRQLFVCATQVTCIACEGKKCLYVDGKPIVAGNRGRLNHNSVVEISGLRSLFLINYQLINTILEEAFQQNQVQLPIQMINATQKEKEQGNIKLQKTTVTKAEKTVVCVQQQQQKMLDEQQKQKLEDQLIKIMENQKQKILLG